MFPTLNFGIHILWIEILSIMDLRLASKIHKRTSIWLLTGYSKTSSVKLALVYLIGLLACAVNPYMDTYGPH